MLRRAARGAGVGVFDPAGKWYLRNENTGGAPDAGTFPYGAGGWVPVAGHYRGPALSLLNSVATAESAK